MKRYVSLLFLLFCFVVFAVWAKSRWILKNKRSDNDAVEVEAFQTAAPVRRDFPSSVPWFGRVENVAVVSVTALTRGRVVSIDVSDGALVKKRDNLFVLGGPVIKGRIQILKERIDSVADQVSHALALVNLKEKAVKEGLAERADLESLSSPLRFSKAICLSQNANLSCCRTHSPFDRQSKGCLCTALFPRGRTLWRARLLQMSRRKRCASWLMSLPLRGHRSKGKAQR